MKYVFLLFAVMFVAGGALAQRTITGTVNAENGQSLIGANVLVKGTTIGTISDVNGNFSLEVPEGSTTLSISFTGFTAIDVDITETSTVDIILQEGELLSEIVVTGYGAVEARKLIASVANVEGEAIENIPLTDVNQLIQGRAPGVYTTANSGQPGAQQQVRIRGTGSITAGRNPLYVIDGVIIEQGDFSQISSGSNAPDALAQINPNDIENVTVLKDASATALYGSRGSNGVILITTKRGTPGDTQITLKTQYGTTEANFGNFALMTAEEQWNYERQILENSGFDAATVDAIRPNTLLDQTTNWIEEAFPGGETYNVELQARGGNEKTRFFISGGYFDQEGTLYLSQFDRLSSRVNLDHRPNDRLSIDVNFNASYSEQNNAVNGNRFQSPIAQSYTTTPMQSAFQEDGTLFTGLEDDWGAAVIGDNFLYSLPLNNVFVNTFRLISKVSASYQLFDNLRFEQVANIDMINIDEEDYDDPTTNDGFNDGGNLINSFSNTKTLTTQSMLKYFDDFGIDHSLEAFAVFEYQRLKYDYFLGAGKGFASGKLQTLTSASEPDFVDGFETNYSFLSYLGQVSYAFKDRYRMNASARRDGSSRFGANNRWATFWSVGLSWIISDEVFLARNSIIEDLRLRASYGTAGNAAIGNFESQEIYGFGNPYIGEPGSSPVQIANPDLTWEESRTLNVGLDFSVLNSRIGGTVEYYKRNSENLLLNVPVSSTSGFTTATRNIGEVENSGIELTLNVVPVAGSGRDGFTWSSDFNISFNNNKVISLPEGEDINNGSQIIREGEPIRSWYMQQWAGVNPADGTPLWFTADDDENSSGITGVYNQAGRFIVGNAEPDFIAGWTNTFSWKGISLSAFLYAAQGHEIYNRSRAFMDSNGLRFGWAHIADALDYWQQPGDISARPQPLVGGNNSAHSTSTHYLEDASFIRLRNASISYQLPSSLVDKVNLGAVSVYAQGVNLWTQTDYSGIDPEADEDGDEFFRYPVGKSITFGLDITF
jgi:TonB-linked SusC/RagA family outer membrane protein